MQFFLNEESLKGQFKSLEDFVKNDLNDVCRCINLINKSSNQILTKISDFYKAPITNKECVADLRCIGCTDELLRLRQILDSEVYDEPYWDKEDIRQNLNSEYIWNDEDVTATSMAEAAENNSPLISFSREGLINKEIIICEMVQSKDYHIDSIHDDKYLIEKYSTIIELSRIDYLRIRYRGTRLNFSQFEEKYGTTELSSMTSNDFKILVNTFDKFVGHVSFESIGLDDGLEYKKYSPSQKYHNKFASAKYKNKVIMKFRFTQKKRVFGYRKDDIFYVLRLEMDHSVSDFG